MTTRTPPPAQAALRLSDPGDLIAALPALLGFPPHRSLVLVCLEGPDAYRVGLVARVDLPHPDRSAPADVEALVEQLSVLCARRAAAAAVLTVVEDRHRSALPHATLLDELRHACEAVGTEVLAAHHVRAVHAGARWYSYFGDPGTGTVPDPQSSPVAAAHVARGRVVHSSRDELRALLHPAAEDRVTEVARLLPAARAEVVAALRERGESALAELLRRMVRAVARTAAGEVPGPEEAAALAAALGELRVRDCCMALPGTEHAGPAEQLWLELVRMLPAPERATTATLLAHSCYARGEGPLAGAALRVALEADPAHRMAGLLDSSLAAGVAPAAVQQLCTTAWTLARELGVALPPLRPWGE